jgi:CTP-dependent riboflavin kinase
MNVDDINEIREILNNRTIKIADAQEQINDANHQKAGIDRNKQEQERIIEQAKNDNAVDRALLAQGSIFNLQMQNKILYHLSEDMLEIPFIIEQRRGMYIRITGTDVLNRMSISQLRYYARGVRLRCKW